MQITLTAIYDSETGRFLPVPTQLSGSKITLLGGMYRANVYPPQCYIVEINGSVVGYLSAEKRTLDLNRQININSIRITAVTGYSTDYLGYDLESFTLEVE